MRKLLFANLRWKLISLAIAILLWFVIAHEPELATSLSAPIQYQNLPADLDISSDLPGHVLLEVRGPSSQLRPANLSRVAVVLDMSRVHGPGEVTFDISGHDTNLPMGVAFYRSVPSQIRIKFEHLESREVPVIPRYSNPPPAGYQVTETSIDPPAVSIIGPESRVEAQNAVHTDPIDLSSVVDRATLHVHIYVGDPQLRLEGPTSVTYNVVLGKIVTQKQKGKRR